MVAAERTVALAAPSPIEGEWVVLAVTPLDPKAAAQRAARGAPIELVDATGPISPPVLVEKVRPQYPSRAREERREGKVIMEAVIDVDGFVRSPNVLRISPGMEDCAAAAVEAVQHWRYRPALRADGQAVPVYFTLIIEFSRGQRRCATRVQHS